jgi:ubiquinol oxidase
MESLGGDQLWFDRFLAEHAALAYYWGLILMYLLSPKNAYAFSELVEHHAADTYAQVSG